MTTGLVSIGIPTPRRSPCTTPELAEAFAACPGEALSTRLAEGQWHEEVRTDKDDRGALARSSESGHRGDLEQGRNDETDRVEDRQAARAPRRHTLHDTLRAAASAGG